MFEFEINTGIEHELNNSKEIKEYILKIVEILSRGGDFYFDFAYIVDEEADDILNYSDFDIFIGSFNWDGRFNNIRFISGGEEISLELENDSGKLKLWITMDYEIGEEVINLCYNVK